MLFTNKLYIYNFSREIRIEAIRIWRMYVESQGAFHPTFPWSILIQYRDYSTTSLHVPLVGLIPNIEKTLVIVK